MYRLGLGQIKKYLCFLPKFTGETLIFFQVLKKKYFYEFERRNAFQNA